MKFIERYFGNELKRTQPSLHRLYPSNAYQLVKFEDLIQKNHTARAAKSILGEITSSVEFKFPSTWNMALGTSVHNAIQENTGVQHDYFTEFPLKLKYKCITISGRLDLFRKDKEQFIDIKFTRYKTICRDYHVLQMQLYHYMIEKIYHLNPDMMLLIINTYNSKEFTINPYPERIENLLDNYIEYIHKMEVCPI